MRKLLQTSRYWQQIRPRIVATAGLLALALMQVSIASHQFEHLADDLAEACLACAQYERLDDAIIASSVELPVSIEFATPTFESIVLANIKPASFIAIRAPPLA